MALNQASDPRGADKPARVTRAYALRATLRAGPEVTKALERGAARAGEGLLIFAGEIRQRHGSVRISLCAWPAGPASPARRVGAHGWPPARAKVPHASTSSFAMRRSCSAGQHVV